MPGSFPRLTSQNRLIPGQCRWFTTALIVNWKDLPFAGAIANGYGQMRKSTEIQSSSLRPPFRLLLRCVMRGRITPPATFTTAQSCRQDHFEPTISPGSQSPNITGCNGCRLGREANHSYAVRLHFKCPVAFGSAQEVGSDPLSQADGSRGGRMIDQDKELTIVTFSKGRLNSFWC